MFHDLGGSYTDVECIQYALWDLCRLTWLSFWWPSGFWKASSPHSTVMCPPSRTRGEMGQRGTPPHTKQGPGARPYGSKHLMSFHRDPEGTGGERWPPSLETCSDTVLCCKTQARNMSFLHKSSMKLPHLQRADFVLLNVDYFHCPLWKCPKNVYIFIKPLGYHLPVPRTQHTPSWRLFPLSSSLLHLLKSGDFTHMSHLWKARGVLCFPQLCTEWMASILSKAYLGAVHREGEDRTRPGWDPGRGTSYVTDIIDCFSLSMRLQGLWRQKLSFLFLNPRPSTESGTSYCYRTSSIMSVEWN